jgi:hypothetical protein
MSRSRSRPSKNTQASEARDARVKHLPDRMPTTDEERSADAAALDPKVSGDPAVVATHYQDMASRGTHQEGEPLAKTARKMPPAQSRRHFHGSRRSGWQVEPEPHSLTVRRWDYAPR